MISKHELFARVAAGAPITNSEATFLCQLCDGFAWLRALEVAQSTAAAEPADPSGHQPAPLAAE